MNFPDFHSGSVITETTTATTYMARTQTLDNVGRMGYVGYNSGATMLQSFTYAYDRYNVTGVTRENSNVWGYTYDPKGQVATAKKQLTAGGLLLNGLNTSYNYDEIGNRTAATENSSPVVSTTYSSNPLNQYTSVISSPSVRRFDVMGYRSASTNTIQIFVNGGTGTTPPYQPASTGLYFWTRPKTNALWNLVETKENGTTIDYGYQYVPPYTEGLTYDLDGNLKTDARRTYNWDAENRLKSITWTAAQDPQGLARSIEYAYDGLSRRVSRKSLVGTTVVDHVGYLYDGWNHIMTVRFNTAGNAPTGRVAAYVWGPDVGSSYTAGRSMQSAGGVGGLLMVLDGVSTSEYNQSSGDPTDDDYFPLMDRMGNVTGYKKASTATPATQLDAIYDYDAFGQEVRSSGPAADVVPYHFSTKFTDATGLVYYGYRWYDAAKGRWLSRDPIGEQGGVNLYGMIRNNSVDSFDILGFSVAGIMVVENPDNLQPGKYPADTLGGEWWVNVSNDPEDSCAVYCRLYGGKPQLTKIGEGRSLSVGTFKAKNMARVRYDKTEAKLSNLWHSLTVMIIETGDLYEQWIVKTEDYKCHCCGGSWWGWDITYTKPVGKVGPFEYFDVKKTEKIKYDAELDKMEAIKGVKDLILKKE